MAVIQHAHCSVPVVTATIEGLQPPKASGVLLWASCLQQLERLPTVEAISRCCQGGEVGAAICEGAGCRRIATLPQVWGCCWSETAHGEGPLETTALPGLVFLDVVGGLTSPRNCKGGDCGASAR